jgi:undecaprenyl-diphosphatase
MNSFDSAILYGLNDLAHRSPSVDAVVGFVAYGNLLKGQVFAVLLLGLWFTATPDRPRRRAIILATLLASLAALFAGRVLAAQLPFRLRPVADPSLGLHLAFGDRHQELENWSAFPSDHAMLFSALATGVLLISRPLGIVAHLYWMVMIGLPRIYLGLHYPTDVVAGGLLGALVCLAMNVPRVRTELTAKPLEWRRTHPAAFYACLFFLCMQIAVMFADVRTAVHGIGSVLRGGADTTSR